MRIKVHSEHPSPLSEAVQPGSELEKARESVTKAETAREQAYEAAVNAREAAVRSAQVTRELFREAKRKARAVQIAAAKARMEAKTANRLLKQADATESPASRTAITAEKTKGNDLLITITEQVKANLAGKPEAEQEGSVNKETSPTKEGTQKGTDKTPDGEVVRSSDGEAREIEWLSGGLFEGRADLLLHSANVQQIYSLADLLGSVQSLKVEFVSGSEDEGSSIAILAEQPIPLLDILGRIPSVDTVTQFGWRKIELSLKKE